MTEQPEIRDRDKYDGDQVTDTQTDRYRHRLIVKQRASQIAEKNQRQEYRAGGQHGSEQRQDHFIGPPDTSLFRSSTRYRFLHDIIQYNDAVVDHHSDAEDDTRQRDDVDAETSEIQEQYTDGQTKWRHDTDDDRYAIVPVKEKNDQRGQQASDPQRGFHIADAQVEQTPLITVEVKYDIRMVDPQIGKRSLGFFLKCTHPGAVILE